MVTIWSSTLGSRGFRIWDVDGLRCSDGFGAEGREAVSHSGFGVSGFVVKGLVAQNSECVSWAVIAIFKVC